MQIRRAKNSCRIYISQLDTYFVFYGIFSYIPPISDIYVLFAIMSFPLGLYDMYTRTILRCKDIQFLLLLI